jgi:hypothetical protein
MSVQLRRNPQLCQAGAVEAELTSGNQWKIPISEIARLQKEGVPPIPQRLSEQEDPQIRPSEQRAQVPEGLYAEPSDGVIDAAEDVVIKLRFAQNVVVSASFPVGPLDTRQERV